MICRIFHNLGQLFSHFYFFDESQKVTQLVTEGKSETEASHTALGISYDKLGLEVAKGWSLPDRLTHSMQPFPNNKVAKVSNELDQLKATVNLAGELTTVTANTDIKEKHKSIQQLVNKYKKAVSIDTSMLQRALDQGLNEMATRANILKLVSTKTKWLKHISGYTNETAEAILQAGIQDVINSLVGESNVNEVIQMIFETMYRGLQCHRVLLFIRDEKTKMMRYSINF